MTDRNHWQRDFADLLARGSSRGFVTFEELSIHMAAMDVDPDRIEAVLAMMDAAGVRVIDTADSEHGGSSGGERSIPSSPHPDVPDVVAAYERDLARVTPLEPHIEQAIVADLSAALARLRDLIGILDAELPTPSTATGEGPSAVRPGAETSQDSVPRDPAGLYELSVSLDRRLAESRGGEASDTPGEQILAEVRACRMAIEDARDRLVRGTMRLVFYLARHYQDRGVELPDLVQEGNAGLLRAAQRFDPRKGQSFASYATWWIRQSIARAVREQGKSFRVPQALDADLRRLNQSRRRLSQRLNREPTRMELAEDLGLEEARIDRLLQLMVTPLRLDAPRGDDDDGTLEGVLETDHGEHRAPDALRSTLRAALEHVLTTLEPREQELVRLRYGLSDGISRSTDDVAKLMKISRARARQIEERAFRKLRHPSRRTYLDPD